MFHNSRSYCDSLYGVVNLLDNDVSDPVLFYGICEAQYYFASQRESSHAHPLPRGVYSQLFYESSSPSLRIGSVSLSGRFAALPAFRFPFDCSSVISVFLMVIIAYMLIIAAVIKATEVRLSIGYSMRFTRTPTHGVANPTGNMYTLI